MNTPSQWKRVRSAFDRIVDHSPVSRIQRIDAEFPSEPALKGQLVDLVGKYHSEDPLFDWAARAPAPSDPLFHEGQVLASRFRIVRFLGRGGMGEVYEAVDTTLHNRPVAIKTISGEIRHNPDSARRFLREVELAQRVTHPNICRIHDIYQHACPDPGTGAEHLTQFLAMQLLTGETLSEYVAKRGALPCDQALNLLRQLAEALAAAHSAGVIHRDFKPSNVILVQDSSGRLRPVITDFGVAVRTDRALDTEADHALGDYTRAGTPEYASPEQIEGGRVTAATDIFALGVVALEMLTGQTGERSLTPLSSVYRTAIARCLDTDPAARFSSPSDFVNALAGEPQTAAGTNLVVSRRTLVIGLASGAVVLGTGLLTRKLFFSPINISTLSILPFEGDGNAPLPGFQEELTRIFLKSRKLRLLAAYSAASLKPPFDFQKMSRILPADAFLTGALSLAEVAVTLVRKGGSIMWQQTFNRHQSIQSLHREIQTAVIAAVDQGESSTLMESSYNPSQEAYLAYVNARACLTRHNDKDLKRAEVLFRQATQDDAAFASAWAGLAYTLQMQEKPSEAKIAAQRAIDIDDKCPEAYLVKGMVLHLTEWKWNDARAAIRQALALEPYNGRAHQWLGGVYSDLSQFDQAVLELSNAVTLDPLNFNSKIALGICLLNAHRYDEAIEQLTHGIVMSKKAEAETARPYPFLATSWLMKGDKTKALEYYRHAVALEPLSVQAAGQFVFGASACSLFDEAQAVAERLPSFPDAHIHPFCTAIAFLGVNQRDRAFEYLNRALFARDSDMPTLKSSIYMNGIRNDSRYLELLAKMNLS